MPQRATINESARDINNIIVLEIGGQLKSDKHYGHYWLEAWAELAER